LVGFGETERNRRNGELLLLMKKEMPAEFRVADGHRGGSAENYYYYY
jgi:hypothetical protein